MRARSIDARTHKHNIIISCITIHLFTSQNIRRIRSGKFRTNSDSSKRLLKENFNSRAYSGTSPPGPRTNRCEKSSSTHLTPQSTPHRQYQLSRAQHFFRVIELSKFCLDPRAFFSFLFSLLYPANISLPCRRSRCRYSSPACPKAAATSARSARASPPDSAPTSLWGSRAFLDDRLFPSPPSSILGEPRGEAPRRPHQQARTTINKVVMRYARRCGGRRHRCNRFPTASTV